MSLARTLNADRRDALAAGASYPTLTIQFSVANNAAASISDTVALDGGGQSGSPPTTSATATVTQLPDMAITLSQDESFQQGDTADKYTVDVSNAGYATSSGTVTVTDTLPTGLTPTAASGTGWTTSISGQKVTATRSDALAASASYPALTITVGVGADATTVTNTAPRLPAAAKLIRRTMARQATTRSLPRRRPPWPLP